MTQPTLFTKNERPALPEYFERFVRHVWPNKPQHWQALTWELIEAGSDGRGNKYSLETARNLITSREAGKRPEELGCSGNWEGHSSGRHGEDVLNDKFLEVVKMAEYRILIYSSEHFENPRDSRATRLSEEWHDLGEGPFAHAHEAICFGSCEVGGGPWVVVDDSGAPISYGSPDGTHFMPPTCPDCGLSIDEGFGLWGCEGCGT